MSERRFPPDDPREWLNRARSNLLKARMKVQGIYLEDLCFDAQQAAEKAIKAVLIAHQLPFPYVHDLTRLLTVLQAGGRDVPLQVQQAVRLTRYAVWARYPSFAEAVSHEEHKEAISLAETVIRWAEAELASPEARESACEDSCDV